MWDRSIRWRRIGVIILFFVSSCASLGLPSAAATPTTPAGAARIWIFRGDEPYVTLARPYVRLNGQILGISEPGAAFYRDVPPGTYKVTVDSWGTDINQFVTVSVLPGQTVYVKVEALKDWAFACRNCTHDTFYTRLIPPQLAEPEIEAEAAYGGS